MTEPEVLNKIRLLKEQLEREPYKKDIISVRIRCLQIIIGKIKQKELYQQAQQIFSY